MVMTNTCTIVISFFPSSPFMSRQWVFEGIIFRSWVWKYGVYFAFQASDNWVRSLCF